MASSLSFAQSSDLSVPTQSIEEPNDQNGDFRYISDDLFIYLRAGPSKDFRLLGSITAGTQVQLLQVDRDAGYAEIIDKRQRTGWVESKFVTRNQSIRQDIIDLEQSMNDKNQELAQMQRQVDAVMDNLGQSEDQKSSLNRKVTEQLEEIARLNEQIEKRERTNNMMWFTRGGILAISALVIGYILGLIGRKRNNQDRLM